MSFSRRMLLTTFSVLLLVLLVAAVFFVPDWLERRDPNEKVIKVGLVVPLSGSNREGGNSMKEGVELAVETINDAGGIQGHKVSLVVYDDGDIPSQCLSAVKHLIFIDNVKAIIGPFSSRCALEIKGLVNSCGIPLVTPVAMADSISDQDDYVFRNTLGVTAAQLKVNDFVDESRGKYTMLDGFQASTIGILWQNDFWGESMKNTVIADLQRMDRSDALVYCAPFNLGDTDFTWHFQSMLPDYPDLIYVIASGQEAIPIVRQGRESGFQGLFMGEGGFNLDAFDKELGAYADGCIFSTQWHPSFSTPMSDIFLKSYTGKFDRTPDMFAALSYESAFLLWDSLERVSANLSSDRFKDILRDDLSHVRAFSGLSGPITIDPYGQADRDVFILQKRWDGNSIQAFIIYPSKYSQNAIKWNFEINN